MNQLEVRSSALGRVDFSSELEQCGLLLGSNHPEQSRVEALFPAPSGTARSFRIEPETLLEAVRVSRGQGLDVMGVYHSHPSGGFGPSWLDHAEAVSGWIYLLLERGSAQFYRRGQSSFVVQPWTEVA